MFKDARSLDRQYTQGSFRLALTHYRNASEEWFDGTVGSVDARLASCSRLLHAVRASVGRMPLTDAVPFLRAADALEADKRALVALHEDLLTGASGREDVTGPPGWRLALTPGNTGGRPAPAPVSPSLGGTGGRPTPIPTMSPATSGMPGAAPDITAPGGAAGAASIRPPAGAPSISAASPQPPITAGRRRHACGCESKPDSEKCADCRREAALYKGAPFAGYEDFAACTRANSDKGDPDAYCGTIKHQVEGARHPHFDQPMLPGMGPQSMNAPRGEREPRAVREKPNPRQDILPGFGLDEFLPPPRGYVDPERDVFDPREFGAALDGAARRWVTLEAAKFVAANPDTYDDSHELATRAHHYAQVKTSTFSPEQSAAICAAFVARVGALGRVAPRPIRPVRRVAGVRDIDPSAMYL